MLLGFVAREFFTARFAVQWIASGRSADHSGGVLVVLDRRGLLLFVCALYHDPVFIAGQGFGVFVYLRNLYFVLREKSGARRLVVQRISMAAASSSGRLIVSVGELRASSPWFDPTICNPIGRPRSLKPTGTLRPDSSTW